MSALYATNSNIEQTVLALSANDELRQQLVVYATASNTRDEALEYITDTLRLYFFSREVFRNKAVKAWLIPVLAEGLPTLDRDFFLSYRSLAQNSPQKTQEAKTRYSRIYAKVSRWFSDVSI